VNVSKDEHNAYKKNKINKGTEKINNIGREERNEEKEVCHVS
jgi:hypothetical protein